VAQVSLQANAPSSRRKLLRTSNLAVNARDAKPQGGPIVIAARPETVALAHGRLQPGKYVCLSLTDTGEGMDEDTLARPIDPFFTTKETGKGTGLGLPMVHGLAEHSGGQLILRSQKGRGTTAELWLPVAKKTEEATEAKAPAQVPATETQIPPGSAKPSSRAATFTPSPKMSASSAIISPTFTPTRNSMRSSAAIPALFSAMAL
jgi:hypothetical protein